MKTIAFLTITLISFLSFAQTDIIEMRSRNASLKNYERSSSIKNGDHVASNYGMLRNPEVRTAVLDSVKAISDSVAVMYTSNYCSDRYFGAVDMDLQIYTDSNGNQQIKENPIRTYPNPRVGSLWQPGADTVMYHPLFSQRHSLDSIKQQLDQNYYFNLPADSIEFIGFDNTSAFSNKDSVQPVKQKRNKKKNSFGWELIFMLVTPILFMLVINKLTLFRIS